jgi:LmbE family N-acetylglucosaminyl deacetylase
MKILFLSPHTDDVELGCGGTIIKFLEEGNTISWVVFSTAEESLPADVPKDTLKKEFIAVAEGLGLKEENYRIFDFKVRHLTSERQNILEELVRIKAQFRPDMVVGPSLNDFHQDHKVVADEMVRAFKTESSIICYELPWNHMTFDVQLFVRLNRRHIARKSEILKNYRSQLAKQRAYFSEEFVHGLAKVRGVQCNSEYAEAFEVIRWMT